MNPGGLVRLGRHLKQIHYAHIAVTPLTHEYNVKRAGREQARTLRDVLGWSLLFARTVVSPREFALMRNAGMLEPEGDRWRPTIRWASLHDHLFAHSSWPTHAEDAVFFGPDTYRFARWICEYLAARPDFATRVRLAADIGCGSGAGAVVVADACPLARIAAVDINPRALELARVNVELAGAGRVTVARSNLLNEVDGPFDLIIANPPYMLDAQERAYRHGGGDLGEGLARQIVEAALKRLSPGGTLLLYTGVAIVDGRDPLLAFAKEVMGHGTFHGTYEEIDPDVFSDELLKPGYERVERIAAVGFALSRKA